MAVFGGSLAGVLGAPINVHSPLTGGEIASFGLLTEGQITARYRFDETDAFYMGLAAGNHYLFEGDSHGVEPSHGLQSVSEPGPSGTGAPRHACC